MSELKLIKKTEYRDEQNKNIYYCISNENKTFLTSNFKNQKEVKAYYEKHGDLPKIIKNYKNTAYAEDEYACKTVDQLKQKLEKILNRLNKYDTDDFVDREFYAFIELRFEGHSVKDFEEIKKYKNMHISDYSFSEDEIMYDYNLKHNTDSTEQMESKRRIIENFLKNNDVSETKLRELLKT